VPILLLGGIGPPVVALVRLLGEFFNHRIHLHQFDTRLFIAFPRRYSGVLLSGKGILPNYSIHAGHLSCTGVLSTIQSTMGAALERACVGGGRGNGESGDPEPESGPVSRAGIRGSVGGARTGA
jgi:hypothetical protein